MTFFIPSAPAADKAAHVPGEIILQDIDALKTALLNVNDPNDLFSLFAMSGAFDADLADALVLESTPEPATLLLFGTTAAELGLARWRRRRQI